MDQDHDWQRMISPQHNNSILLFCPRCKDWKGCPGECNELSTAPPRLGPCDPAHEDGFWRDMIEQLIPETQHFFTVTSLY